VTGRAAAIQGGLAALGLITAHLTWQREPERAPGEVAVIDAGKNDLGRVHYEDDTTAVDFERRQDASNGRIWVRLVEKPAAKVPPPADPNKPVSPAPTPATPPREVRGSETAEKLVDQFTPLRSPRAFGVLDAAKLKELGLDAPKKKLTVTVKGDTREYAIGQPPGGTGEAFLRDARDGRVYLMPHGMLGDLQSGPNRLVDRKLHGFETAEFDKVVISVGAKRRELVQTHRENAHAATLASEKTPEKPDQMAKNWHDMLWRSFPMEVLGKGETPKDGAPVPFGRVEYFDGKKSLGWIELASAPGTSMQQTDSAGNRTTMFARTERTPGWVKLHVNGSMTTDAEKIVAAQ
jgi:hypothetical protein